MQLINVCHLWTKTVRKLNFALLKTSQGAKVYTVNRTKMEDTVDMQIKCALKGFIVFNVILKVVGNEN